MLIQRLWRFPALACALFTHVGLAVAETPPRWRGVNPDMLSGGLYAALEAEGAFGPRAQPARARADYADLSKGRAPAVLDVRVGVNTRLGADPDALPANQRGQAEPHIVRSPTRPDVLLATFQEGRFADAGAIGCGYAVSIDGGLSWTRSLTPNLTTSSGGRFNRATDPVAGAGPQGELYLQALASVQGAFTLGAVVVSRSVDFGMTWTPPVVVFESNTTQVSPDKNWLAVNAYLGTSTPGRLVSTWTNFLRSPTGAGLSNPLVASVSDDRGVTWSSPIEITPAGSSHQGTQPVFLPDGSLAVIYIAFLDPNDVTRFNILCKRSLDGGRTFPALATSVAAAVQGWDDPELRDGIFLPSATVARDTGDLMVTYNALIAGTPRVMFTKSSDRGASWSVPSVASDQPAGTSVTNPTIAATPDGQAISIVFTDKRLAPGGKGFVDQYAAQSFDGGVTWQPNFRLSEQSSDLRYGPLTARGVMLGDYSGIAPSLSLGQPCVTVWCDTRTGDSDPYAVRFLPTPSAGFAGFRGVRGLPSGADQYLNDDDNDGTSNYLEYLAGTDPLIADSGSDVVIRQLTPTRLEFLWVERAVAPRLPVIDGVSVIRMPAFTAGGFSQAATVAATLSSDQLPASTLPAGLEWRGVGVDAPVGMALAAARSVRFSAGVPVRASTNIATIGTDARLVNLSTRGSLGTATNPMIVGFVIDGPKNVLVRAAGPGLVGLGVINAVADPSLLLTSGAAGFSRTNDNWQQGSNVAPDLFARLGAFAFALNSRDAALAIQLAAQNYTAVVTGNGSPGAVVLVEAYDADAPPGAVAQPRFVNLATRGYVDSGDSALIAGFVVSGSEPRRILVRGVGPGLAPFGVVGVIADPVLIVFRGAEVVARNDDWSLSRSSAATALVAQRVGAFSLTPESLDAALLLTLTPGAYTAIVTGSSGATGVGLVEVYDVD